MSKLKPRRAPQGAAGPRARVQVGSPGLQPAPAACPPDCAGVIVTLFLAMAAIQFVIQEHQPASSYILPTQQAGRWEQGGL